MAEKQLIVAVEGTAAVAPYWKTIISDYLHKILRSFCGNDSVGQKPPAQSLQFGLVVFSTHDSNNACLVQRSGWTRDIDILFKWLSSLSFCGGGFNDAAIAEGLSEALMMLCPLKANQTQQNVDGQRHCILIAAKCSVSLSVICPKQLPKLEAIFNARKCNPRTDPPFDSAKNPSFLVLISENLMEGGNAVSRPGMQNWAVTQSPVKVETNSAQPVSGPLSTPIPAANGSNRPATVGNIQPVTVKVEPPTVTSMMPTPGMSQPQQTGMQQLGVGDNTAANMSLSQQNSVILQSLQSNYVKVWEGNLSGQRQGQPVFITRLEGYRSASASESLAANWTETMQIVRLISQDHMNNKQYVEKADFLVFRAMNPHGFLGQMQEKKLCAVIQLPSQTLLLSGSDNKACPLIGMLFPGDMVVFTADCRSTNDSAR